MPEDAAALPASPARSDVIPSPGARRADEAIRGIGTALHPAADVAAARKLYAALIGIEPQTDSEYCVGFDVAGRHIGLVPTGAQGLTSQVASWHVADPEAQPAGFTAAP